MSVEKNKELLRRQTEELWIKKDASKVDEFFAEEFILGSGKSMSSSELKKWLEDLFADGSRPNTVKTDYHDMVGEGDVVMARQTNHMSDGTAVDGVTVAHFKDGKLTANYWFVAFQP